MKNSSKDFNKTEPSVLVVDDSHLNRLLLKSILEKAHLSVDLAKSGTEACEFLKKNHYHLLLLDHNMPVLNGVGVAKFILENIDETERPVTIAISGIGMDLNNVHYRDLAIKDFIIKPITLETVFKILEIYIPKFILPQYRSQKRIKEFPIDFKYINSSQLISSYLGDPILISAITTSFLENNNDTINLRNS